MPTRASLSIDRVRLEDFVNDLCTSTTVVDVLASKINVYKKLKRKMDEKY
jgi:hypothetical protein